MGVASHPPLPHAGPAGRSRVPRPAAPGDDGERRATHAARAEQHGEKESQPAWPSDDRLIDDEMRYMTDEVDFSWTFLFFSGTTKSNVRKRTY
jgi:hypothetical protein